MGGHKGRPSCEAIIQGHRVGGQVGISEGSIKSWHQGPAQTHLSALVSCRGHELHLQPMPKVLQRPLQGRQRDRRRHPYHLLQCLLSGLDQWAPDPAGKAGPGRDRSAGWYLALQDDGAKSLGLARSASQPSSSRFPPDHSIDRYKARARIRRRCRGLSGLGRRLGVARHPAAGTANRVFDIGERHFTLAAGAFE